MSKIEEYSKTKQANEELIKSLENTHFTALRDENKEIYIAMRSIYSSPTNWTKLKSGRISKLMEIIMNKDFFENVKKEIIELLKNQTNRAKTEANEFLKEIQGV